MDASQQQEAGLPAADAQADRIAFVAECLKGIDALGGKIKWLHVVRVADVPELQARAQAGDQAALALLTAAATMGATTMAATPADAPRCLGCDAPMVGRPYSVVAASAGLPESPAVFGPVCTACGTEPAEIRAASLATFTRVWPGFRLLPPMVNAIGRA